MSVPKLDGIDLEQLADEATTLDPAEIGRLADMVLAQITGVAGDVAERLARWQAQAAAMAYLRGRVAGVADLPEGDPRGRWTTDDAAAVAVLLEIVETKPQGGQG